MPDDLSAWRTKARALAAAGIRPERIVWTSASTPEGELFGTTGETEAETSVVRRPVRATKAFLDLAGDVILHREEEKFSLLYHLLWRLQTHPGALDNPSDVYVHRLTTMARQVRRDIHKMRAFVRFRRFVQTDGQARYTAWFEPDHHIVRRNTDFFLNRFASQAWSILTPALCLHWDGKTLSEAAGANRCEAPQEDDAEDLWRRYYASIFNPARLKVAAMTREMPKRYWKNLPEAQLIPQLIASAQSRESAMVRDGEDPFKNPLPENMTDIAHGLSSCRACPIGCNGTRAVAGVGPVNATRMIVGEQPGDHEERKGLPFVGPAGQLLDKHFARAGIDRHAAWITNAVKHFKYEQRGKRRLHQNPSAREIDHCRWWLDAERRLLRPRAILALGASAGRAILGRTPSIGRERGNPIKLPDGSCLVLTLHPAAILRHDSDLRAQEEAHFQSDLRLFTEL